MRMRRKAAWAGYGRCLVSPGFSPRASVPEKDNYRGEVSYRRRPAGVRGFVKRSPLWAEEKIHGLAGVVGSPGSRPSESEPTCMYEQVATGGGICLYA